MAGSSSATDQADEGLEAVLADYLRSAEEGRAPDRMELLARHPSLAPELAAFFAGQDRFGRLAAPLREAVSAVQESTIEDKLAEGGRLGDFRIVCEIGRGGMGVVYEAEQISLGRKVALKVLPFAATLDQRQLQRFRNESLAAAQLDHPHIVDVYCVGTDRGVHYYAMRLIDGQTLARVIADLRLKILDVQNQAVEGASAPPSSPKDSTATIPYVPQLAPQSEDHNSKVENSTAVALTTDHSIKSAEFFRKVAEMGQYIAEALHQGHEQGIIHRDIKPSNLMLDGRGKVWVTDFGLAHVQGDKSLTMTGDLVGTLRYMSPEQVLAKRIGIDHRTDIYSLGVTLYELLTLQPAYGANDRQELLRQIAFEEPRPPRRINRSIPPELETIVQKAMENNPADRYATAQEMADDLQRFLEDKPIRARRAGLLQKTRKWGRRHPAVISSALVLLVMAMVSSIVSLVIVDHQRRETALALSAEKKAKESAEAREAETKAVLEFVENKIFAAARPEGYKGGLGNKVTLRKAVEAALPFVDKSFPDQPLIEARLRKTLGVSFLYLGDPEVAADQFRAARMLYVKQVGPDHPDTLGSMNNLAISYADLGRHAEALKVHEETLALLKAKLGPDHPATLLSMSNLANTYAALARYADALNLHEETLALRKAKLGPDNPDTLGSMNNLADTYENLGRHADALNLYEETLAVMKAKIPDHPFTLNCMNNLANSYAALSRYADALKLREETLALFKTKLGPDHPYTLISMSNLANSYRDLGRQAEALKLCEETLALRKAKLGPDHPDTLTSMHNLANSYDDLGRRADAVKLREETLALRKAKLGPDHPDTLGSMNNLANSYGKLGRLTDALKLHQQTLTLTKAKLGSEHPETLLSMSNVANSYAELGRHGDALKLREDTLALRKAKLGPDHPDTLWSMGAVAQSLVKLDRGAEAVPIIDECIQRAAGKVVDPNLIAMVMDSRLRHFEKTKDAAGCRATAEMWEKLNRADANSLYDTACCRAVTAAVLLATDKSPQGTKQADTEADRAMAWLRQAIAASYNNAHMKEDADLDVLRNREDFKNLLTEMEAKAKSLQQKSEPSAPKRNKQD